MNDESGITGITFNGTAYYYRKNIQGDVQELLNANGGCVAKYSYDAWGVVKVHNPDGTVNTSTSFIAALNPIRYRGYYYDQETKLYYLQSRYYDPEVGRFINADDAEIATALGAGYINGLNLYSYCFNNPIKFIDDDGCWPRTNSEAMNFMIALFEMGIGGGLALAGWAVKVGTRANNIGIGVFQKAQAKYIANLTKGAKVLSKVTVGLAIVATGLQVYEGIQTDIARGYTADRIMSNVDINIVIYGGLAIGLGALGAKIGLMAGSAVPGLGNVIGAAVGFGLGIGMSLLLETEVFGKSLIDHIRDGAYEYRKFVVGIWRKAFDWLF